MATLCHQISHCAFRSPARSGLILRGPFLSFFPFFFSLEKSMLRKLTFPHMFGDFQRFSLPNWAILGRFWVLREGFLWRFWWYNQHFHFSCFFIVFLLDFQYFSIFAKTLSSSRVACKIHGFSRVGHTSKKHNNVMFFSSIFGQKWPKKV